MQLTPPDEKLLNLPSMDLMDLYGRMRSLTDEADFEGTLPAIWQCSDESQAIKKALFGYVYNCPPLNLGQIGALLDPTRLVAAANHGNDLVIMGGSHIGAEERAGIGYIRRVHNQVLPCCGTLHRILNEYLQVYQRATQLIKVFRKGETLKIEVPYMYLFHEQPGENVKILLKLDQLVDGEASAEGSLGKVYRIHPRMLEKNRGFFAKMSETPVSIERALTSDTFSFSRRIERDSSNPRDRIETSISEFLPEIVSSSRPHKRLCDVNTWREFHRISSYLTDSPDVRNRNIFVLAGLTIDHTVQHNTFIPQFGFWMEQGCALESRYFDAQEIHELLSRQNPYKPPVTFLEYAGQS